MQFEWDPVKAAANQAKHDLSFADAIAVFDDPLARTILDRHENGGEERWQTTGMVAGIILIVVVHTVQSGSAGEEIIRVISARRATKHERRAYER